MADVLVVGAGPAGCVAATVLARAGVRVRLLDRAVFPRDKLCGDTVNPGTLALLRELGVAPPVERDALRVEGMLVTNGRGFGVTATYGGGLHGLALSRRHLDALLLQAAADAGADVHTGVTVREAIVDESGGAHHVRGVLVAGRGMPHPALAPVTIAADGRRSTLAFGLGLAHHPIAPRRWAIGAYFGDVSALGSRGEMHVRTDHYIGVAPLPGGIANACLVTCPRPGFADPDALLRSTLMRDPLLHARFADARQLTRATTLGPLAVDAPTPGLPGLLLAGDAAGFIDPLTGDGLRFAVEGGRLAAATALEALEHDPARAVSNLHARRDAAFGSKRAFNRMLRRVVGSDALLRWSAWTWPAVSPLLRAVVAIAGDLALARRSSSRAVPAAMDPSPGVAAACAPNPPWPS